MKNPLHLTAIVAIAFLVGGLSMWVAGENVTWRWLLSITTASTATGLAILAFNRWIWRIPLLQGWFVRRPHLAGIWRVEILSLWIDPETGTPTAPIVGQATITQTHGEIHFHLETEESEGDLIEGSIVRKSDGRYQLVGIFLNRPKLSVRDRSAMHHGALMLDIVGNANTPTELKGNYWNERRVAGEIRARPIKPRKQKGSPQAIKRQRPVAGHTRASSTCAAPVTSREEPEISERIRVSAGTPTSDAAHFRAGSRNLILELFVRSADENYVTARWCAANRFHIDFLWNAVHALEKYLKAVLLMNGETTLKDGHDIVTLYDRVEKVAPELLPDKLDKPLDLQVPHWPATTAKEFVARLYREGNADNRYLIFGYNTHSEDLHMLDAVIFAVRRLICRLDEKHILAPDGPSTTNREVLLKQPLFYPRLNMPLDQFVRAKDDADARRAALNLNMPFAPADFEHAPQRSGFSSRTPVLLTQSCQVNLQRLCWAFDKPTPIRPPLRSRQIPSVRAEYATRGGSTDAAGC